MIETLLWGEFEDEFLMMQIHNEQQWTGNLKESFFISIADEVVIREQVKSNKSRWSRC